VLGYNGRKLGSTNCATGGLAAVEAVLDDSQVASMDLDSAQGWFVVSLGEGKRVQLYTCHCGSRWWRGSRSQVSNEEGGLLCGNTRRTLKVAR